MSGRAEASSNRYSGRESPPPQAPSVPAFGSLEIKPASSNTIAPNPWKTSPDQRPPRSPPPAASQAAAVPRAAPTAPKAQLATAPASVASKPPPEAPKAPRALEIPPTPRDAPSGPKSSHIGTTGAPTAPAALRNDDRVAQASQPSARRDPPVPGPSSATAARAPLPQWPSAPTHRAPRSASVEVTTIQAPDFDRKPPAAPSNEEIRSFGSEMAAVRSRTPPPFAPSGPRVSHSLSTSPKASANSIPTAPKVGRAPPTGPRASQERVQIPLNRVRDWSAQSQLQAPPNAPRGPTQARPPPNAPPANPWNQWVAPTYRDAAPTPPRKDPAAEEIESVTRANSTATAKPTANVNDMTQSQGDIDRASAALHHISSIKAKGFAASEKGMLETTPAEPLAKVAEGLIDDVGDPIEPDLSEESSEDDGMDLDEEDFEVTKLKFEQHRARLEAQLADLSEHQYRATTPLEQLARLAKITVQDFDDAEDIPETISDIEDEEEPSRMPSQEPGDDNDLLTPKEEEPEDIHMQGNDVLDRILPPPRRRLTPEVINLPYLVKTPVSPRDAAREHMCMRDDNEALVVNALRLQLEEEKGQAEDTVDEYGESYRRYRDDSRRFDVERERLEREEAERQQSVDGAMDSSTAATATDAAPTESNRSRLRFASEYELQKIMKESEELARKDQERMDREHKKAKDELEKEAVVPDMWDEELSRRRMYKNTNSLRNAWYLTEIFGYQPPSDDFSVDEHRVFLEAYKERPKKWGEIATLLPGRTYQHCIHHYYAHKWDGRFRESKTKRKTRIGRGRGGKVSARVGRGAGLMADLGRAEEDISGTAASGHETGNPSGRPKRAAASRIANQEKDTDGRAATTATPGRKAKAEFNGEAGAEKPAKRRRTAATEKGPRKVKAPALAAAPIGSPVKTERDLQFRATELSREDMARVEEASLLAGLQTNYNRPDAVAVYHTENFLQPVAPIETLERPRPQTQSSQTRPAASSYWSVPEQQDFVKFIAHFGTDFAAIATHMGTKTQVMVRITLLSRSRYVCHTNPDTGQEFLQPSCRERQQARPH